MVVAVGEQVALGLETGHAQEVAVALGVDGVQSLPALSLQGPQGQRLLDQVLQVLL